MLKNPKGSPLFSFFGIVRLFFKKKFFSPKVPFLQFFWWFATEWMKNLKVSPLVRHFCSTFGFFRYRRREYSDRFKSFCCFWASDMAPTWAVPGLFSIPPTWTRKILTKRNDFTSYVCCSGIADLFGNSRMLYEEIFFIGKSYKFGFFTKREIFVLVLKVQLIPCYHDQKRYFSEFCSFHHRRKVLSWVGCSLILWN